MKQYPRLTLEQKRVLYRKGQYSFPSPPVCHAAWDEDAWIHYIDLHGKWTLALAVEVNEPLTGPTLLPEERED